MTSQQFQLPRSVVFGGRDSLNVATIRAESKNGDLPIDAEFLSLARKMSRKYCQFLCASEGAKSVRIRDYQSLSNSALGYYEGYSCFMPGETYVRHTLNQQLLLNINGRHCKLTVSSLVHYASEDNLGLSIFPSRPVSYAFSLHPILTRIDTIFSSAGGAKSWQYSSYQATPILAYHAFLDMIHEAKRYSGISVAKEDFNNLPFILKECAEKVVAPFSNSPDAAVEFLAEVRAVEQDYFAAVDIRCGDYYRSFNCFWKNCELTIKLSKKNPGRAQRKFARL